MARTLNELTRLVNAVFHDGDRKNAAVSSALPQLSVCSIQTVSERKKFARPLDHTLPHMYFATLQGPAASTRNSETIRKFGARTAT
jgi:hypothetical protein